MVNLFLIIKFMTGINKERHIMSKNGKNKFYRTLNLRKQDKQALNHYTELKTEMEKDTDIQQGEDNDE